MVEGPRRTRVTTRVESWSSQNDRKSAQVESWSSDMTLLTVVAATQTTRQQKPTMAMILGLRSLKSCANHDGSSFSGHGDDGTPKGSGGGFWTGEAHQAKMLNRGSKIGTSGDGVGRTQGRTKKCFIIADVATSDTYPSRSWRRRRNGAKTYLR